jgi:hypothetical protein
VTETTGYPALYESANCRHVPAELPGARVFRAGQPMTIRLVGSGCIGFAWPDIPTRIDAHGAPTLYGLILVDEAADLGETSGYLLNAVRVDDGTSFPIPLYGSRIGEPATCVILPARDPEAEVGTRRQMRELLAMTGWSNRTVAGILRTSHVTVGKIASEGSSSRSSDVAERLASAHACVRRLAPLAADVAALRAALESPTDELGTTAAKLLTAGEYARAYRFAMQLLAPAPAGPLLRSRPNVSKLAATVPVAEQTE